MSGAAAEGPFASGRSEPYSAEFVLDALRLDAEIGMRPAAEQLGISMTTLGAWKRKALQDYRDAVAAAVSAGATLDEVHPKLPWVEARQDVGNKLGAYADMLADQVMLAMLNGQATLVRAGAMAVGIFVDRAQILHGGKAAVPLTPEERAAREERIIERIRRRKAAEERRQVDAG